MRMLILRLPVLETMRWMRGSNLLVCENVDPVVGTSVTGWKPRWRIEYRDSQIVIIARQAAG